MNKSMAAGNPKRRARDARLRAFLLFAAILSALLVLAWATDSIRARGVSAIYTVECKAGAWDGNRCYGRLVPGPRYRFEVLAALGEVHFSNSGEPGLRGSYSRCTIEDRINWSCEPNAETPTTIAHRMTEGRPVPDPAAQTRPFHEIEKWRWLLLRVGIPVGHDAS